MPWGFNGFFAKKNGGGFLTDEFPMAQKSIWDFHGIYTTSRHIPGVRFAGQIHPGLIGCLPSHDLLKTWNKRELGLIATDPDRVPPLANPPVSRTAHMGKMKGEAVIKRQRKRPNRPSPRARGQLRYQGPLQRIAHLLSRICRWGRTLRRRSPFRARRR